MSGALLGRPFAARDATIEEANGEDFLILTDYVGVCALNQDNTVKAKSGAVVFDFYGRMGLGLIPVGSGVDVQYAAYDDACYPATGESAGGGSVTIAEITSSGAAGTFDVTLGSDHLTGTFNAPRCVVAVDEGAKPACQ